MTVALEEYRALREEIVSSLSMQQTVLSFSTLALGGLALAGFHELGRDGNDQLALLLFLLVLPLVSYVSLFIWLGEYVRTTRAGAFLQDLEGQINDWIGDSVLMWERHLRTPVDGKCPQYAWNVAAIFSFYAAVPIVATIVVTVAGSLETAWFADWPILAVVAVYALEGVAWLAIVGFFLRGVFRRALIDARGAGCRRAHRWKLTAERVRAFASRSQVAQNATSGR